MIKSLFSNYRRRTINRDVTMGLTLTVIVVLLFTTLLTYSLYSRTVSQRLETQAERLAAQVAQAVAPAMAREGSQAQIDQIATTYLQAGNLFSLQINTATERLQYPRTNQQTGPSTMLIGNQQPIIYQGQPLGQVEVTLSRQRLAETQQTFLFAASSTIVITILTLLFATHFLLQQSLGQPLESLRQEMGLITEGNYNHRLAPYPQQEIDIIAQQVNKMGAQLADSNQRLHQLISTLEQKVAERTHRLELAAMLSGRLAAILDLNQLLAEVVKQIKENFEYHHALIYLLDESGKKLVVAEGTGPAGAKMKSQQHSIPLTTMQNTVARAARSGEVVRMDKGQQGDNWSTANETLLPGTQAEIAVPIILEQRVVGVLNVQEQEITALDDRDVNLLQGLTSQIAIAIRNAHHFAEVENALLEARLAQEQYLTKAWHKLPQAPLQNRYLYRHPTAPHPDENQQERMAQLRQQVLAEGEQQLITQPSDSPARTAMALPITVRDTVIGTMQLHASAEAPPWTKEDVEATQLILDQFAQTAETMRLFDETRRRANREQIIREITEQMRSATSLEELVKTAASALTDHIAADRTVIKLGTASTK